jgi:hypothetical protein
VTATATWNEDNQTYLAAALRRLREIINGRNDLPAEELDDLASRMTRLPALGALAAAFGLSAFERELVLLCAGVELDADLAGAVRGEGIARQLTFSNALAFLPGAHWSALAPSAPLRRWRLLEIPADVPLTQAPLRAAERVVHFLAGVQTLDANLEGLVTLEEPMSATELAPSHARLADRAVRAFTSAAPLSSMPLIQLVGHEGSARDLAGGIAAALGLGLAVLHVDDIPAGARERERLARLWEREGVLSSLLLLVDAATLGDDPQAAATAARFLDLLASPTLALVRRPLPGLRREDLHLAVEAPPIAERMAAWQAVLPDPDPSLKIERIAGQFALTTRDVRTILGELALREPGDATESGHLLWDICRERSRPRLEHLTDRLSPAEVWDDLVLPDQQKRTLREIVGQARLRNLVYGSWGFAAQSRRGLGLSALFAGPSGTGKTMAAEAIAELLRLDLYRIDLSRVVSKYIGETERNLGLIFDEAEGAGGIILLFDEADALFGKRTEVRDSHDRYANLEISYLLQRMEAYDGLAILTTNLKNSLDPAFLRRIRFVVPFPFPDAAARARIWRGVFPPATPTDGLTYERLARLNVAGGNIRTIALNAAFAAADTGGPVQMIHILAAARTEYAKLERPLNDAEIRGWI